MFQVDRCASVRPRVRFVAALLAVGALMVAAAAAAASVVALAPADSIVVIRYAAGGSSYPALEQDLEALDLASFDRAARGTLEALKGLADKEDVADLAALERMLDRFEGSHGLADALGQVCPATRDADIPHPAEALLSVSMAAPAAVPAATLIVRVDPQDVPALGALVDDVVGCFGDGPVLDQDGTTLHVLGNGSDQPITLAQHGALLIASTQVDAARGVVRRANGSSEPSLAGTPLGTLPALTGNGVSAGMMPAALADLLDGFGGMLGSSAQPAVQRLSRALRTVPYVAVRIEARPEGLVAESWLGVDDDRGDPALARLLRCETCRVRPNILVPADAFGVSSLPLRLRDGTSYLIDLTEELMAAAGEPLDLRQSLREHTGIDLDHDLFSWLGDRIDVVTLPPVQRNLNGILGQTATAVIVPVASVAQAKAGIARLTAAAQTMITELQHEASKDSDVRVDDFVATRSSPYRDIDVTRVQFGPTTDVGIAYLGNHLVIASPAEAIDDLVDTYLGGPNVFDDAVFRDILRQSPDAVSSFEMLDEGARLRAVEPLLAAMAQPIAFGVQAVVASAGSTSLSFADMLDAAELAGRIVSVIADHLGVSRGWTQATEAGVYGYTLLPIR